MLTNLSQFKTTDLECMLEKAKSFWNDPDLIDPSMGLCFNLSHVVDAPANRGYDLVEVLGKVWSNRDTSKFPSNPVPKLNNVNLWDNPYRWDLLHFIIKSLEAELDLRAGWVPLRSLQEKAETRGA